MAIKDNDDAVTEIEASCSNLFDGELFFTFEEIHEDMQNILKKNKNLRMILRNMKT